MTASFHFGPYRIVRRLGSGGMGTIFEAEDARVSRRVALKLLHPQVAERPGAAERFLQEGQAAARIRHPHVIEVIDLGMQGETPYLAMELLDGGDLSQLMAIHGGRLPLETTLEVILPVISAVAAAHEAGVVHRDLKPSNTGFMLDRGRGPCPKVVDFGVSKVLKELGGASLTLSRTMIGTPAYMAPEQANDGRKASARSDQYSVAAMLYRAVTGVLPFPGKGIFDTVEAIMTAPLFPPSARVEGLPPQLDAAVLRAMSRDPDDRFPSIGAFGAALSALASRRAREAFASLSPS